MGDRRWETFKTPAAGLDGVFSLLSAELYRRTGGALEAVMNLYNPAFENDWGRHVADLRGVVGGRPSPH